MKGKLNAYATTMMGRPVMRTTAIHKDRPKQEDKPIIVTRNQGFNLWQWLKKYGKKNS